MTDIVRPGTLMTAEQLYDLPDRDKKYELVRGELRIGEPPGHVHGVLAVEIASRLTAYVRPRKLGVVTVESGYVLARGPDTVRGPDVSFIRRDRRPSAERAHLFVEGPADLGIEIVSPGDRRADIAETVADALAGGVRLVWVIYPKTRHAVVHAPGGIPQIVHADGALLGGDVIPGFSLPLADLFAVLDD